MPTFRGEQNKFDYLIHLYIHCSAAVLCKKRETDMYSEIKSVVLLTLFGQQFAPSQVCTKSVSFTTLA